MLDATSQLVHMLSTQLKPTHWYQRFSSIVVAWFVFSILYFPWMLHALFHFSFSQALNLDGRTFASALLLGVFSISSGFFVLRQSVPGTMGNRPWWMVFMLLAAWFLTILVAYPVAELTLHREGAHFVAEDFSCDRAVFLISLLPSFILLALNRWLAPARPRLQGAYLFLSTSAAAALCLEFVCPHKSILHLLYGHVGMVLGLGLFGLCLGKRLLKW